MTRMGTEPGCFALAGGAAQSRIAPAVAPPSRLDPAQAETAGAAAASCAPPERAPAPWPRQIAAEPVAGAADTASRLRPLALAELFALALEPRGMLLDPIIPEKGLAMLYGTRGSGKTHVALGIAYAVATGSAFLRWRAARPRRVLLIDGEMPAQALRERLARLAAAGGGPCAPAQLAILAGDLIDRGIGNLAAPAVQAELEPALDGVELLILDNLSSLTTALRENDADAWSPLQEWLLRLRRRGISVLMVHHAGKGGEQRGTSRREDVLDTSISLRRPDDYAPAEGARFTVHIEKGRGIHGEQARPFEARLDIVDGRAAWTMTGIGDAERARVAALLDEGWSIRDIARETGLARSRVHRLKRRIEQEAADTRTAAAADAALPPPAAVQAP